MLPKDERGVAKGRTKMREREREREGGRERQRVTEVARDKTTSDGLGAAGIIIILVIACSAGWGEVAALQPGIFHTREDVSRVKCSSLSLSLFLSFCLSVWSLVGETFHVTDPSSRISCHRGRFGLSAGRKFRVNFSLRFVRLISQVSLRDNGGDVLRECGVDFYPCRREIFILFLPLKKGPILSNLSRLV